MRLGLISALLVSLLSLVSCGGDDALTESEYRAAGNEVCNEWFQELSDLTQEASNGSEDDIVEFTAAAGLLADEYTARLLNLSTPESLAGNRAIVQQRLDEFDALVASSEETDVDFNAITDAGNAISEALGDIWSGCRSR